MLQLSNRTDFFFPLVLLFRGLTVSICRSRGSFQAPKPEVVHRDYFSPWFCSRLLMQAVPRKSDVPRNTVFLVTKWNPWQFSSMLRTLKTPGLWPKHSSPGIKDRLFLIWFSGSLSHLKYLQWNITSSMNFHFLTKLSSLESLQLAPSKMPLNSSIMKNDQ